MRRVLKEDSQLLAELPVPPVESWEQLAVEMGELEVVGSMWHQLAGCATWKAYGGKEQTPYKVWTCKGQYLLGNLGTHMVSATINLQRKMAAENISHVMFCDFSVWTKNFPPPSAGGVAPTPGGTATPPAAVSDGSGSDDSSSVISVDDVQMGEEEEEEAWDPTTQYD